MRKFNPMLVCISASLILLAFFVAPTRAANVVDADANGHWTPRYPEWDEHLFRVDLNPALAKPIAVWTGAESVRAITDFSNLNWIFSPIPAPGNFRVIYYDVDVDKDRPFKFTIDYVSGDPNFPRPGYVLQWIQFINTNDPKPNNPANAPYIDPTWWKGSKNWEDNLPFYWNETATAPSRPERPRYSAGGDLCPLGVDITFYDRPLRYLQEAPVKWLAHLYLVEWDTKTTVIVYDGIEWGFTIECLYGPGRPLNTQAGVAGDKFETYGVHYDDPSYPQYGRPWEEAVGGIVVPVDKFGLLAPYIGLASTILVATVATAIYTKRVKRRKEKQ